MTRPIDEQLVRHVADLARLELSDHEVALYMGQLQAVLNYMARLDDVDTRDVEPTAHPLPVSNVFAEDQAGQTQDIAMVLRNAPACSGRFFVVPRVLAQRGEA
ncbi:MAG: Asp-tRNA(Asn)/Glu-tRNA(Gln) amidotransferase subunit GatC [Phycisphaerales bacterium]|nr:MAG: Asp-tRNA(Asn)/Glu-tRNA(Gln) amidotransferase subunit GatC [Phycisphaerales bacterium]